MSKMLHLVVAVLVSAASLGNAATLAYEPVGLAWSAEEVERLAATHGNALMERASRTQSLSFARLLLPRQPVRSVRDMYVEMDFNFSLRRAMAPVMQQGEPEADELGFLMASAAGSAPDRQLAFLEQECKADTGQVSLIETYPSACSRLRALQPLLPLARRQ